MNTVKRLIPKKLKPGIRRLFRAYKLRTRKTVLKASGRCPCCVRPTTFRAFDPWLRDYFLCDFCESIPRERALMWTIDTFVPDWRTKVLHESSPGTRGASIRLARECQHYVASQYFPDIPAGNPVNGVRSENLEALSFADESIDLHVTQDVFEHIYDPAKAFKEIARTLRPGGAHIFTTPLVEKSAPTQRCASLVDGKIVHLRTPEYHMNPVSAEGSLVTMRWGYDICDFIFKATGLFTHVVYIDALELGIRAEYIEVLVTRKPA